MTDSERGVKGVGALIDLATLGSGSLLTGLAEKGGWKLAAKAVMKEMAVDALASGTAYLTGEALEELGLPPGASLILTAIVSGTVTYVAGEYIFKDAAGNVIEKCTGDELDKILKGEIDNITPEISAVKSTGISEVTSMNGPLAAGPSLVQQGQGYALKEAASKIAPLEGYTDVIIHGTPDSFGVWHNGKWEYIDQRSLATYLKNNAEYNGGSVRLISCSTGADPDGIAQQLANKLGVNVLAPSDTLYIFPDGSTVIGSTPFTNTGSWEMFMPGKY